MDYLIQSIIKATQTHDHVLVFTQSHDLVLKYLLESEGRYHVKINETFWRKDRFKDERITEGRLGTGFKVAIESNTNNNGDSRRPHIGLDCEGDKVTYTRNPFFPIRKGSFVIKFDFKVPGLEVEHHLPAILAIQKKEKPIQLYFSSVADYNLIHDQLSIQDITHTLYTQGETSDIHLSRKLSYFDTFATLVCYSDIPVGYIGCMDGYKQVVFVSGSDFMSSLDRYQIKQVTSVFLESPESAINEDYISFKTWLHPNSVKKYIYLLSRAKIIKKVTSDSNFIMIHKKGTQPKDIDFHAIPEGEFTIPDLMRNMRINREDVFPTLKKYEGNGLIFSYSAKKPKDYYVMIDEFSEEKVKEAYSVMYKEKEFMDDLLMGGSSFINSFIDKRIQEFCLQNKSSALIQNGNELNEISPMAKHLNIKY